ncbi:MAG TPA: serine protease, partial [Caulobacteraceae bacterium]|nr:serine protease [Caulobacteraceae bacterium]
MSRRPLLIPLTLLVLVLGGAAAAQEVPTSAGQINLSFAPVVRRAGPAVVNVYARVMRQSVNPFFQMFGPPQAAKSLGSGVIVRADGVIVTN